MGNPAPANPATMTTDPSLVPDRSGLLADAALRAGLTRFIRGRVPVGEVEDIVQATLTEALASSGAPEESQFFEFAYDPTSFTIPADTATDVTLDNTGVVEHDITVDELDLRIYADPASSTTESVTAPAGTYTFYCSIPGHRDSGMEGTLTVEG